MEILGYVSSTLIGFSLGLLGAGGSILTLPVLVYFFKLEPANAVRYSLFVVGTTSLASSIPRFKKGEVLLAKGLMFSIISTLIVLITRKFILPLIPAVLFSSSKLTISYGTASMIAFSILMLIASRAMIKDNCNIKRISVKPNPSNILLFFCAVVIGLLTGLLGAGGGFLLVPVFIVFFQLEIRKAVGTSLLIITLNSIVGFLSDLNTIEIEWEFILIVTSLALFGALIGQIISGIIETQRLKQSFGWFILVVGILIFTLQICKVAL